MLLLHGSYVDLLHARGHDRDCGCYWAEQVCANADVIDGPAQHDIWLLWYQCRSRDPSTTAKHFPQWQQLSGEVVGCR